MNKIKKIVIATTNNNKVKRIKDLLFDIGVEVASLSEMNYKISEPKETANTCTAVAIEKALHYVTELPEGTIVLTQDDSFVMKGINPEDSPGLSIKEPVIAKYGKITDELGAKYYADLANKYGGTIDVVFEYGHAIAIRLDDERKITKIVAGESKLESRLVNKVNKVEKSPGYFLAAVMQEKVDGNWIYYNELTDKQKVELDVGLKETIVRLLNEIELVTKEDRKE